MSELVPFFSEDEELDENLLRSIETILDDNEQNSSEMSREPIATIIDNGMANAAASTATAMPPFQASHGSFGFGNQVYQKWSPNESAEVPTPGFKRNFVRNPSKAANFMKPMRKNVAPTPPPSPNPIPQWRANAQIAQYQAMLAEKANQLLMQYVRLNYEGLNAQAQILGIPLEQYIRNLLIALNNQPLMMPNQMLFPPFSPMPTMTTPTMAQQRAFTKQYFNKRN